MPITPDRLFMDSPGLDPGMARTAAQYATYLARQDCPKLSGQSAFNIVPIWGRGYFGLHFLDYIWVQNVGAKPQTMRWLAGKTIPMWIDDPTGVERRKYPKAKTRTTASGRVQVLLFRRAANFGERKLVKKKVGGIETQRWVPKSYPGAPGRIALREAPAPFTTPGRIGGRIASGNIGVRWYFPGLKPRGFLDHAIQEAATYYGILGSLRMGFNFINENEEIESLLYQPPEST